MTKLPVGSKNCGIGHVNSPSSHLGLVHPFDSHTRNSGPPRASMCLFVLGLKLVSNCRPKMAKQ